jgi:BlaI family transcriptional regulator, penicillinase repressor
LDVMRKMGKQLEPTDVELRVLRALWNGGSMTAAQLQKHVDPPMATGALAALLSRMVERGLIRSANGQKPHVYETTLSQRQALRSMLSRVARLLTGSAKPATSNRLVRRATSEDAVSEAELAQLHKLIEDAPE